MICPFCGVALPTLTPATSTRTRHTVRETLRVHSLPHERVILRGQDSPEDLGAGRWVLAPNRLTRVWQAA